MPMNPRYALLTHREAQESLWEREKVSGYGWTPLSALLRAYPHKFGSSEEIEV